MTDTTIVKVIHSLFTPQGRIVYWPLTLREGALLKRGQQIVGIIFIPKLKCTKISLFLERLNLFKYEVAYFNKAGCPDNQRTPSPL